VFRRFDIPYRVVGGFSFYERAEIKDVISYLTAALNLHDSVHLLRILNTPPRGIGKTTVDALLDRAAGDDTSLWDAVRAVVDDPATAPRSRRALVGFRDLLDDFSARAGESSTLDLLERIIGKTGYMEMLTTEGTEEAHTRIDNLRELLTAAAESGERGETIRDFLDNAALVSDQDQYDEQAPVTMMTLHTAKGLEFPVVFIMGMEDGLFPHSRSISENRSLEEERRLFYVGMTRAEERLYLTWSRYRRTFGAMDPMISEPSRFLREIPPALIDAPEHGFAGGREAAKPRSSYDGRSYDTVDAVQGFLEKRQSPGPTPKGRSARPNPKSGWTQGARVKHPRYGVGTVLRIEGAGDEAKLTVSFNNHGMKKLVARYASLEKI
jgi:DNA helicase-2/ATP-dependent DNA helicase PcrA